MGCRSVSGSPCLPAEHTDAGCVNPNEPPGCLLALHRQCFDKGVSGGAVGVPVLRVDPSAPAGHWLRVPALGLEKVLLENVVVNVDLSQHCHLFAFNVGGRGFVPNPHADAVAHRELSPVQHGVRSPLGPGSPVERTCAAEECQALSVPCQRRGLSAEQHPRRAEPPLLEILWVHGDIYSFPSTYRPSRVAVG